MKGLLSLGGCLLRLKRLQDRKNFSSFLPNPHAQLSKHFTLQPHLLKGITQFSSTTYLHPQKCISQNPPLPSPTWDDSNIFLATFLAEPLYKWSHQLSQTQPRPLRLTRNLCQNPHYLSQGSRGEGSGEEAIQGRGGRHLVCSA